MTRYFVGDVQGCYHELMALLERVGFSTQHDELWLVGDIVARGPNSLETLRFVKSLGEQAKMVLGNHDLHLLATYEGLKQAKPKDQLATTLTAPDIDELMYWLAQQPLLRQIPNELVFMSHAGISPQWTIQEAIKNARFAEKKLQSENRRKWLAVMYGEKPNHWHKVKTNKERFRFTINSFTRMRFCHKNGSLEFQHKMHPKDAPKSLHPWFINNPNLTQHQWIFGHWAALLGETDHPHAIALDTGCVWGNCLTMMRWPDKQFFVQPALKVE
jgi:bis(5'-nucleosyl)-tetraphosphatase (symmetrical)